MGALLPFKRPNGPWGHGIVVGAAVTSQGRHGAGQPVIYGTVAAVGGQTVTVTTKAGPRKRTISNLRVVGTRT